MYSIASFSSFAFLLLSFCSCVGISPAIASTMSCTIASFSIFSLFRSLISNLSSERSAKRDTNQLCSATLSLRFLLLVQLCLVVVFNFSAIFKNFMKAFCFIKI